MVIRLTSICSNLAKAGESEAWTSGPHPLTLLLHRSFESLLKMSRDYADLSRCASQESANLQVIKATKNSLKQAGSMRR